MQIPDERATSCCNGSSITHSKPIDRRRLFPDDNGGITRSKPNHHRHRQTTGEDMTVSKPSRDRGRSGQGQGTTNSKPNSGRDSTDGVVITDDLDFGTKPVKCFCVRIVVCCYRRQITGSAAL